MGKKNYEEKNKLEFTPIFTSLIASDHYKYNLRKEKQFELFRCLGSHSLNGMGQKRGVGEWGDWYLLTFNIKG